VSSIQELNTRMNIIQNTSSTTLQNIKYISSANGTWSIDEEGRIVAKSIEVGNVNTTTICVEGQCLTKDDVRVLLDLVKAQQSSTIPNSSIPSSTPTPEPIVAGTSTTGVADSNQQPATNTDPVTPTVDPAASSTDPITPPADPVITPVVDPVVPLVDPPVVDPVI
ncbi:MAG: hypothetical protein NTW35_03305, partial [Candidatus Nomurabacteria bacterium]|nr:hypothetical protein [Candidatus Nomurabacteria bacterium]